MQNPPPALYTLSFGIRRLRFKRTAPQHWYLKARALPAALQTGRNLLQEACLLIPFASRVYGRVWDSSLEFKAADAEASALDIRDYGLGVSGAGV